MGRLIGIDYGLKRTGLAVTDPLRIISTPLETVVTTEVLSFLKSYLAREEVDAFVVGMPRTMSDADSPIAPQVKKFVDELQRTFPEKAIHLVDERFTSSLAKHAQIQGGMKKKDRRDKANLDKISAAIILQGFLESGRGK
ncbi:MAG: Holliday junction resolvase RuvX [Cyclobacteriaceae bacterium]|nr:Holliday junction resolvase RuvX [Cyclobacteriaceae bacterium]